MSKKITVQELAAYFDLLNERNKIQTDQYIRELRAESIKECVLFDGAADDATVNAEAIIFKEGVEEIAPGAFAGVSSLKTVFIPKSLLSIGAESFADCINLYSLYIHRDCKPAIGDRCFYGCISLKDRGATFFFPSIGKSAFENCTALEELTIYTNSVGSSAFENCSALENVWWCSHANIPEKAFKNCVNLRKVAFVDDFEAVGDEAFDGCINFTVTPNITFVSGVSNGKRTGFIDEEDLPLLLKDGLLSIGRHAFRNCYSLHSFELPYTLQHIHEGAFEGCVNIELVGIYPKAKYAIPIELGEKCFNRCDKLRVKFLRESTPSLVSYLKKNKILFQDYPKW